jgi:hypothetical protein
MTLSWTAIGEHLAAEPEGTRLRLPRPLVPHPLDGGLERGVDLPVGQRADFRLACGERVLCVQDFGSHYEAFFAPEGATTAESAPPRDACATAGALVALILTGKREATLVGALLGAALGRRRG